MMTVEDHARGLSTFTIMAGLGGFMGDAIGGINWDATSSGIALGGHLNATFTLITIIFINISVSYTITSFKKIPLYLLERDEYENIQEGKEFALKPIPVEEPTKRHGAVPMVPEVGVQLPKADNADVDPRATLMENLISIVYMLHSMRMVCLTNLFCWMGHICYSLYFTDFVGEAVYGGDPKGTDVAIDSSMVFLAQCLLSCCLGTIVSLFGSILAVVFVTSTLAARGAVAATQIMYLDLSATNFYSCRR